MLDIKHYSANHKLRDGGTVHIRSIRPEDKRLLVEGFSHLSQESVYCRFLGFKKRLTEKDLSYFTEIDHDVHIALIATLSDEDEEPVGVGRYIETNPSGLARTAEVALTVVDDHQGRGIGSLLFDELIRIARSKGISQFEAYVLADNRKMIDIFKHHGFDVHVSRDSDVLHLSCSIDENNA